MSNIISNLVKSQFWPFIKTGIILFSTFLAAGIASKTIQRWSDRKLNNLKDKEKSSATSTRIAVFRRTASLLIWLGGIIAILYQYPAIKSLGMGLFASAGVLGLVLGLAAQSTLSNMIAGIMISFSQPIRLGDAVIMEDDFGYIEEITLIQTFIRTWDNRRIIVPNDLLSNKIIQNWSIKDPSLLSSTIIYMDYGCDVKKVRNWIREAIENSSYWNGEGEPTVQVIDFTEKTIKLRALAWAKDPPTAWNLRCEIRERLLEHFREEGLQFPKFRIEMEQNDHPLEGIS